MTETESERFRRLVLPLLDEIYTLARYLTRNATEAEDAAQETFVRALRYFGTFSGGPVKPWLCTILRNVVRSRDPRRFEEMPEDDSAVDPLWGERPATPEANAIQQDEAAQLHLLIDRLPAAYRETLLLKEFGDLSYREIAEITGVPIGTVMSRLARARTALQEAWRMLEKAETP